MKAWVPMLAAAAAALASLPAQAGDRHHHVRHHRGGPGVGFGYVYRSPFLHGRHWHAHWHPPRVYTLGRGLGIGVAPRAHRHRTRSERPRAGSPSAARLFVYPAAGQSEAQTAEDRYQCHVWAADQSDFDPTLGGGSAQQLADYNRAVIACMEGRDYVVK